MAADRVAVVGVGMITAVGLSAAETAASVRAGIMMFAETSIRDHRFEPITLAEVIEDGLPDLRESVAATAGLTSRVMRMLRLAAPPLVECLGPLAAQGVRPPIMLALPELETTLPLDRPAFLERLAEQAALELDVARSDASFVGRAGGLMAIGRAADAIRLGETAVAIAGGVDTYRDLYALGTLDMEKRIKSAVHFDGFIPGEGAGFLLLASAAAAERAGLRVLGMVSSVSAGYEEGHLYSDVPYRGDGLAAVVRQLAASGAADVPIQEVYSSMNGENHWAKEWGVSFIRNRAAFAPEHGMHHPADCFGDTGAACGPLMVGLAALGMSQGYRRSPTLVYCSSDRGDRAALTVTAP
jgi:3-oxoacyl-[acyl-carrier-protein] synthase I